MKPLIINEPSYTFLRAGNILITSNNTQNDLPLYFNKFKFLCLQKKDTAEVLLYSPNITCISKRVINFITYPRKRAH